MKIQINAKRNQIKYFKCALTVFFLSINNTFFYLQCAFKVAVKPLCFSASDVVGTCGYRGYIRFRGYQR